MDRRLYLETKCFNIHIHFEAVVQCYILNKSEKLNLNCLPSIYKNMQTKNAIESVS